MKILPLMHFLDDPDSTRWTVLYAGPLSRRMLPGLQRHIVFEGGGRRFIVEHDWVNQPLSEAEVRDWLERLRSEQP